MYLTCIANHSEANESVYHQSMFEKLILGTSVQFRTYACNTSFHFSS